MNRRPQFALRMVRKGRVRINGVVFVSPKPAPQLEGKRMAFGLYWTEDRFQNFVNLFGTENLYRKFDASVDDFNEQWQKDLELVSENGSLVWEWWHAEASA